MIPRLKNTINRVYHFWCFTVWQRREFYTPELTRMMIAHGVLFWLFFYGLAGYCFYHLFNNPAVPEAAISLITLFGEAWLSDHLNDYSRAHPDNLPN